MPRPSKDLTSDTDSELFSRVYEQLRAIASRRLAMERTDHTLQATALVHEAYMKLSDHPSVMAAERGQFFRAAAEAMRQILIDHARSKGRQKRGGGRARQIVEVADLAAAQNSDEILALDEAVRRLEQTEPRAALVVKLRFYAGLTVAETAEASGLSVRTVNREWTFARAWLYKALE